MPTILQALLLTVFAGMSTVIGSFIALFAKKTNTKFLSVSLGFSAGVMIYVSFMEIMSKSKTALISELGLRGGTIVAVCSFFFGIAVIALIDKLIPSDQNPHEIQNLDELEDGVDSPKVNQSHLMRTGILTALAIAIHNFPEGLMTFISALQDPALAIPIVAAIAIHNIPEGIAVSAPIYYATGSKKKAFWYSAASGLTEPIGAIIGYLLLMPFLNDMVYGILFGTVAGIMVFISLDELLPSARAYGEHHLAIYGMVAGMAVMALSLILFL